MTMEVEYKSVQKAVKSWKIVQKIPNYTVVVGQLLFKQYVPESSTHLFSNGRVFLKHFIILSSLYLNRIFEIAPGAISMFSFGVDFDEHDRIPESLFSSTIFLSHATRVVGMLETALTLMLQDELEDLAEALRGLGSRHVGYGVEAAHYTIVATALLRTLEIGLGNKWTPKLRAQWASVIRFVTGAMKLGAQSALVIKKESGLLRFSSLVSKGLKKLEDTYFDVAKSGKKSRSRSPRLNPGGRISALPSRRI